MEYWYEGIEKMILAIMEYVFFWSVALMMIAVAVSAPIIYLRVEYPAKRSELLGRVNSQAAMRYFHAFPDARVVNDSTAKDISEVKVHNSKGRLAQYYDLHFGIGTFVIPLLIYALVMAFLVVWVCYTIAYHVEAFKTELPVLPAIAAFAISGAYVFTVYSQIGQTYRRDLIPSDLLWSALRLVIAVPAAYALAQLLRPELGSAMAFLIGVFPMGELVRILRRIAIMNLRIGDPPGSPEESQLQRVVCDIDQRAAERFAHVNITTISQLAYSDPIQLMVRTGLGFGFVTDCISQALLGLYLHEDLAKVRQCGLRGAHELANCYAALHGDDNDLKKRAHAIVESWAKKLGKSKEDLEWLMGEVAEDPYVEFLHDLWSTSSPTLPDNIDDED